MCFRRPLAHAAFNQFGFTYLQWHTQAHMAPNMAATHSMRGLPHFPDRRRQKYNTIHDVLVTIPVAYQFQVFRSFLFVDVYTEMQSHFLWIL